jgi:hypothetical protein
MAQAHITAGTPFGEDYARGSLLSRSLLNDVMSKAKVLISTLSIRPRSCSIRFAERESRIDPRLMQVLIALHNAAPDVATRRTLREQAWGDAVVGDTALNRCIARWGKPSQRSARPPQSRPWCALGMPARIVC